MKFSFLIIALLVGTFCSAQKFDGFIITHEDSLFEGYMHLSSESNRRTILITRDKNLKPRTFYVDDLKYYAFKKDTFALLPDFYPFVGDDYVAENLEAKVIVSKGRLKLYQAEFPYYRDSYQYLPNRGNPTNPTAPPTHMRSFYKSYIVKLPDGQLYGIRNEKSKFIESIEFVIAGDKELLSRVRNKELRFKDTEEIIRAYNRKARR
ncbi:MAG: hypothetical protein WD824_10245 [Cyclobacteriaceae bacterium]